MGDVTRWIKHFLARAILYVESRSERFTHSLLRGLAPSVYEWNRECRGLAGD